MADQRTARPVSGEIMAGRAAHALPSGAVTAFDDIIDADYEIVSPPERDPDRSRFPAVPTPSAGGMAMLRRAGGDIATGPVRGGPIFWIFGMAAVAAAFWVSGGHALIHHAAPKPAAALTISGVSSRIKTAGEKRFLHVDGHAANDGEGTAALPPLEIRIASNDGRVTSYKLGTYARQMRPGERFAFSSRLDVPKSGVKTVSVTFGE
ncbi:hypothetical protein [Allomesorhizobium alhagi]|jgi:hypothetical protein|uniref:Transmembrane protein n=1 Tax=Mesorhizobium alhagi CCNWXJ12-2 TaxID=1107882 RepID=H0HMN6_9HYPH|nr:hypothetical protein [Mesorhizobium alhagi]EHK58026.1 hypothetical protein MAXJ12_07002 [Mesorhizobium alhagi CCNWXJ12-2]